MHIRGAGTVFSSIALQPWLTKRRICRMRNNLHATQRVNIYNKLRQYPYSTEALKIAKQIRVCPLYPLSSCPTPSGGAYLEKWIDGAVVAVEYSWEQAAQPYKVIGG